MKKNDEVLPLECSRCHRRVGEWLYWRFMGDKRNPKCVCIKCLTYEELDWRDQLIYEWRRKNPEFNMKPKNEEESKEFIEMCWAYLRKNLKRMVGGKLPYSRRDRLAPPPSPPLTEELERKLTESIKVPKRDYDE